ncbi:MAG TPA: murein biosynthesis integral membrane protein MurJ [Candidatus Saccharimonadales bacterium]|nr:murein biosynthesis integral membrane protein MurJ [Candidatus Saccharimonadales bacterium]
MNGLLARANRSLKVEHAAGLLAASALVSGLLGLLRYRLLAAHFGIGTALDAYNVAFIVPDFMFFVLTSGALSVTFIPVLNERLNKGNKKSAWELSSSLINFLALITFVASLFIIIFAEPLVHYVVAPGLSPQTRFLAASMMRIIAVNPFLFSISSVLTSMQQAAGRFFFFALAPSLYSLGIIFGIIYLAPHVGVMGVAYGVVIGSIIQLLAAGVGMWHLGFEYRSKISWRNLGFRRVLMLLPARSIDQGIDYFNTMVEVNLASRLQIGGAIASFSYAMQLALQPITLIGVAISTAVFPKLTERINQGRRDLFRKDFRSILRVIIWLALPIAVIAFFTRGYLVRLLVANGDPTIAALLGFLVIYIFFRCMYPIVSRAYYAHQDVRTPLYTSLAAIAINIGLAVWLARPSTMGIYGLAVAESLDAVFELAVLFFILIKRYPGILDSDFINAVFRMISASGLTGIVTYAMVAYFFPLRISDAGFVVLVPKFIAIVGFSFVAYLLFSFIFRITEVQPVIERIVRFIFAGFDQKNRKIPNA